MKPFQFQKFTIHQLEEVFRVGTDGVLLGALCTTKDAQNILEVGCGTGLISLMIAQRTSNSHITAIDINLNAVELSAKNFSESIFKEKLNAYHGDFKNFVDEYNFDLIVCNPPYFEESRSEKDKIARQNIELNFLQLIEKSSEIIDKKGILSVIIPYNSGDVFIEKSENYQFHLIRKVTIYGITNSAPKRLILEFSKKPETYKEEELVIEKSERQYSDQYLELTKEFHVFGK